MYREFPLETLIEKYILFQGEINIYTNNLKTMTRFVLILFFCIVCTMSAQRPSSSHRSDVYIAGFFPYGDGVENAATGKFTQFLDLFSLNNKSFN